MMVLILTFVRAHIFMNQGVHKRQAKPCSSLLDYIVQQINRPLLQVHVIGELCVDHWHISQWHWRLRQSELQLPRQGSYSEVLHLNFRKR